MTDHPGDRLSAYLDGELDDAERARVDGHVSACAACRAELEGERAVRSLLRSLPAVEPPPGFYDRLLAEGFDAPVTPIGRSRRRRFGWANVAATAAAWLVFMGIAGSGTVSPSPVAAADVIGTTAAQAMSLAAPPAPMPPQAAEAAARYNVPSTLAGTYRLVGFEQAGDQRQALFSDGDTLLRVHLVPGRLDWRRLPTPRPVTVNGAPAWQVRTDDADVLLVQLDDAVMVVAGPPGAPDPGAVAGELTPRLPEDRSVRARLTGAARGLLDTFGLRG